MNLKTIPRALKHRLEAGKRRRWAKAVFENPDDFMRASTTRGEQETVLVTKEGLKIAVRHNMWDTRIVEEQFRTVDYLKHFKPPVNRRPVVVDVGGYIGDFSLYCAHVLGAHVVAYEPTAENAAVFKRNLSLNPQLSITLVERGISSAPEIVSNVTVHGREVHASSEWYADTADAEHRLVECDTLADALGNNGLNEVDLLKVDCEGGEYEIFRDVPAETFARIDQIVFEWHKVDQWQQKLATLDTTLRGHGYLVHAEGNLRYAIRP